MNGFRRDIRDRIIGTNAHVLVNAYGKQGIPNWQQLVDKIHKIPGVVGVSPYYQGQVMLKSGSGVTGVLLQGIDPPAARPGHQTESQHEGRQPGCLGSKPAALSGCCCRKPGRMTSGTSRWRLLLGTELKE